jgi:CheY-like chemotaxis protein
VSVILVVEDDPGVRGLARDLLTDEGHDVVTAESGEQALAVVAHSHPSLILADLTMPGMDGRTLVATLRERYGDVPVVLVSGAHDIHETAEQIDAVGATEKPFDIDMFIDVVRRALATVAIPRE